MGRGIKGEIERGRGDKGSQKEWGEAITGEIERGREIKGAREEIKRVREGER